MSRSLPFVSSPHHPLASSIFLFFFSPSGCSLCTPCRYIFGLWVFDLCLSSSAWELWNWALAAFLDEETRGHRALRESPLHPGQQQSPEQSSLRLQTTHSALEERAGSPLQLTATGPRWVRRLSKVKDKQGSSWVLGRIWIFSEVMPINPPPPPYLLPSNPTKCPQQTSSL